MIYGKTIVESRNILRLIELVTNARNGGARLPSLACCLESEAFHVEDLPLQNVHPSLCSHLFH